MASRMRRSVTSAVRTCPSTMCRRAVAKSVIAVLDLKKAVRKSGSCAAISRKTQVSPCDCHVIVGGLWLLYRHGQPDALISQVWPRGGVVTQRTANPRTPVQFRAWPPPAFAGPSSFPKQVGFVIGPLPLFGVFPGSSVVEQPAVNRLVAGSNPARGATSSGACRNRRRTTRHRRGSLEGAPVAAEIFGRTTHAAHLMLELTQTLPACVTVTVAHALKAL